MIVALDLDDFNIVSPRMDILYALKAYFPKFKVSMFTIPCPRRCDYGPYLIRDETAAEIRENLDWLEIIPHGLTHESSREFKKYDQATFKHEYIPTMQEAFADAGLPYVNGFKAPHWRQSEGVTAALNELGWWGTVLREDTTSKLKRFYRYNYLLNELFWESTEPVLKLHGHIYGTKNDVGKCFTNLLKLPQDTEFQYVSNFIETNGKTF